MHGTMTAEELAAAFREEGKRLSATANKLIEVSLLLEGRHFTQAGKPEEWRPTCPACKEQIDLRGGDEVQEMVRGNNPRTSLLVHKTCAPTMFEKGWELL